MDAIVWWCVVLSIHAWLTDNVQNPWLCYVGKTINHTCTFFIGILHRKRNTKYCSVTCRLRFPGRLTEQICFVSIFILRPFPSHNQSQNQKNSPRSHPYCSFGCTIFSMMIPQNLSNILALWWTFCTSGKSFYLVWYYLRWWVGRVLQNYKLLR